MNNPAALWSLSLILLFSTNQCTTDENSVYRRIRDHAEKIKVINTHEHQHLPEEYGNYNFRFYHLLAASYLAADVASAGVNAHDWKAIDSLNLDKLWEIYGDALDYTRNTSYYGQFVQGFRKLYGFNEISFTRENIGELSSRIETNYNNYSSWFDQAFKKAGFQLMFIDQYWKPFNTEIDERYFALAFNINALISESGKKPDKEMKPSSVYRLADEAGHEIEEFGDYLEFCDILFKKNARNRAVSIKNSQAYSRTLYYEDIKYEEAKELFERPSSTLTSGERKKIEDYMFHWIIQKSVEYNLPVQIHTGYLAGNRNVLDNGQPVKLNNLFIKYPKARFVLFHGGFPWTGEYASLGKMFPNVYLDLVWLSQISREEAVSGLDVMLDCVPYNKFFWGGDCGLIEESTGALAFAKDVVSETLSKRIKRGLLTEEVALEIIDCIFRNNAVKVFNLKEKGYNIGDS